MPRQSYSGLYLQTLEVSRSHSDTTHSVGILWTSDQPDTEASTWQHTTLTRERCLCSGEIRTRNPNKRASADIRPTLCGHLDRRVYKLDTEETDHSSGRFDFASVEVELVGEAVALWQLLGASVLLVPINSTLLETLLQFIYQQRCKNSRIDSVLKLINFSPLRTRLQHLGLVDCLWNVMAHVQKPDFVFRRKRRVHLNRWGSSVQSTTGNRGVRISGSNAGYTMFRGSVKSTGYQFHSTVSPPLPHHHVTVRHFVSTGLYYEMW